MSWPTPHNDISTLDLAFASFPLPEKRKFKWKTFNLIYIYCIDSVEFFPLHFPSAVGGRERDEMA